MNERTPSEYQTFVRIRLAIAAYAYEHHNLSIMSDTEFDTMSREVDTSIATTRPDLDQFFKEEFEPDTGMWIHEHPELAKIASLYQSFFKDKKHGRRGIRRPSG